MTAPIEVVGEVTGTIASGDFVVVAGVSGTGKTSLLHAIAGVAAAPGVEVRGVPARSRLWHDLTLVPQSVALLEELTVADNIALPSLVATGRPPTRLDEVLDPLGLRHLRHRLAGQISVGERQRTMVARAVATPSALLLADEPTAHQDDGFAARVRALLRDERGSGRTCIVATRDPAPWVEAGARLLAELTRRSPSTR